MILDNATHTDFVPATFFERGVAVPFTTPLLAQARIRLNTDNEPEFILPNLSGGRGRYVMTWKSIRRIVVMTVHDRALCDALGRDALRLPPLVRRTALQTAARGLAGSKAARHARELLEKDQHHHVLTSFLLVSTLLERANLSTEDLMHGGLAADDVKDRIRNAIAQAATEIDLEMGELHARLETLSALLAPVGLPDAPDTGRLRAIAQDVGETGEELKRWAGRTVSDVAGLAEFSAEVATVTASLADDVIRRVDRDLVTVADLVSNWQTRIAPFTRHVTRLHWLLDGWDYVLLLWRTNVGNDSSAEAAIVAEIFRLLPLIPRNEYALEGQTDRKLIELAAVQRRWVRANEDWRPGRLDYASVRQIEAAKAAMP